MCNNYSLYLHQQNITSENVLNITSQLQAVVSQATKVDQSASNLAVVTNVITQAAKISSPTAAPVLKEVHDVVLLSRIHTITLYQTIINVVSILSSIQYWPPMVLERSGSM